MKGREGGLRCGRGRMEQALSAAARGSFAEAVDAAAPLIDSDRLGVEERLDLIRLIIEWNGLNGSFMECRRLAGRAVELGTNAFGARDPRVLIARSSELYWMCEVGYDALAEHRFAPLIDDVRQVLGTEHDLWWAVRTNSAMPAKAQGRFKDAADIYRGIIVDIAECLPENDLRVLTVRDNYAEALFLDPRCPQGGMGGEGPARPQGALRDREVPLRLRRSRAGPRGLDPPGRRHGARPGKPR